MVNKKKEDPRAVRSRSMLKQAAKELLIENPDISKLTVKQISKHADLNRATFYLHYFDINDILVQVVYDIFDDLSSKMSPDIHIDHLNNKDKLIAFLDYFYQHRKILSVFFEHVGFKKQLHIILKESVLIDRHKNPETAAINLSNDIIASSLLGIIMWWLKDGVDFSSEYIANQIIELYS